MSSSSNASANSDPVNPKAAVPQVEGKSVLTAIKPLPGVIPNPPGARITGIAESSKLAAVPSGPILDAAAIAPATPAVRPKLATPAARPKTAAAVRPKTVSFVSPIIIRPVVALARIRSRHRLLVASFALIVLLPILIAAAYLWGKAADQYASTVGFSVRREEAGAAIDMLGGLAGLSKSSSSDTDILYEYLRSQKLGARVGPPSDHKMRCAKQHYGIGCML